MTVNIVARSALALCLSLAVISTAYAAESGAMMHKGMMKKHMKKGSMMHHGMMKKDDAAPQDETAPQQ